MGWAIGSGIRIQKSAVVFEKSFAAVCEAYADGRSHLTYYFAVLDLPSLDQNDRQPWPCPRRDLLTVMAAVL